MSQHDQSDFFENDDMTNVHNNSFPLECAGLESVTKPLLHPESFAKLNAYRQKLERGGLSLAANRLQALLATRALDPLHDEPFLEYVLATCGL